MIRYVRDQAFVLLRLVAVLLWLGVLLPLGVCPARAQPAILDGLFVQTPDGAIWAVVRGSRFQIMPLPTTPEELTGIPVGDDIAWVSSLPVPAGPRPGSAVLLDGWFAQTPAGDLWAVVNGVRHWIVPVPVTSEQATSLALVGAAVRVADLVGERPAVPPGAVAAGFRFPGARTVSEIATTNAGGPAVTRRGSTITIQQYTLKPSSAESSARRTLVDMHRGSRWEFYRDGSFVFIPTGVGRLVRDDLYPIRGTFEVNDDRIELSGIQRSSNSTSRNSAAVSGRIVEDRNGDPVGLLTEEVSIITAACVYTGCQSQSAYEYAEFTLPLEVLQ